MANNRLFIGNKDTKEVFCFSKDLDNTWRGLRATDLDDFNKILETDSIWQESSNLILFSESDSLWFNYFYNNGDLPK